jgi:esterase/lipase
VNPISYVKRAAASTAAFFSFAVLTACHSSHSAQFDIGDQAFPVKVAPYNAYLEQVEHYIENNRTFIGPKASHAKEIAMNMPFECGTQYKKTGILFVHGLGDSPFFFRDVAAALCAEGIYVRTILLPGHGTKPGDMLSVSYEQWQTETNFHIELFSREVEDLYVGGFSTGANLTTIATFFRNDIKGLIHFSPAFKSRFFVSRLAPYIDSLFPWPNVEEEDNPSRYNSTAMPGFAAYQESVNQLQTLFNRDDLPSTLAIPVLMTVAEKDSVVDTEKVAEQFRDNFTDPNKCLLWQGEVAPDVMPDTLVLQTMQLPDAHISAASHMSSLFSPRNALYGAQSDFRICDNGQGSDKEASCLAGDVVWFGPWGYKENDKVHARLTYNPYFTNMVDNILGFVGKSKVKGFCQAL